MKKAGVDKSWHEKFKIPDKESFSLNVQRSIQSGVVDSKSRREIHQTLRTLILQHTWYPGPDGYNMVCQKLTTKFASLRDESATGYVSKYILKHACYILQHDLIYNPGRIIGKLE